MQDTPRCRVHQHRLADHVVEVGDEVLDVGTILVCWCGGFGDRLLVGL